MICTKYTTNIIFFYQNIDDSSTCARIWTPIGRRPSVSTRRTRNFLEPWLPWSLLPPPLCVCIPPWCSIPASGDRIFFTLVGVKKQFKRPEIFLHPRGCESEEDNVHASEAIRMNSPVCTLMNFPKPLQLVPYSSFLCPECFLHFPQTAVQLS